MSGTECRIGMYIYINCLPIIKIVALCSMIICLQMVAKVTCQSIRRSITKRSPHYMKYRVKQGFHYTKYIILSFIYTRLPHLMFLVIQHYFIIRTYVCHWFLLLTHLLVVRIIMVLLYKWELELGSGLIAIVLFHVI